MRILPRFPLAFVDPTLLSNIKYVASLGPSHERQSSVVRRKCSEMMQYYIEPNLNLMRDIHYWRLLARDHVVVKQIILSLDNAARAARSLD